MAKIQTLQASFIAGILSPRLLGRFDLDRFTSGALDIRNMLPAPQGGLLRRPGTRYITTAKSASPSVRLIPFQFSTEQTYVLEFGPGYMRVYANAAQLKTPLTGTAIVNGTFSSNLGGWLATGAVTWHNTYGGSASFAGDAAALSQDLNLTPGDANTLHTLLFHILPDQSTSDAGLTVTIEDRTVPVGSPDRIIAAIGSLDEPTGMLAGDHSLVFDPAGRTSLLVKFVSRDNAAGTIDLDDVQFLSNAPFELISPYGAEDLPTLKWTQSADVLYLAQGNHPPYELRRTALDEFQLQLHNFLDGPYYPVNDSDTTLNSSAGSALTTITASSPVFSPTDASRFIRLENDDGDWAWLEILSYSSPTSVTAWHRRGSTLPLAAPTVNWRLGSWSDTTGWPETNALYQSRLVWAATFAEPQTIWLSVIEGFASQEPSDPDGTVTADAAINVTIADDQVNAIRWLAGTQEGLFLGTSRSEAILRRPSLQEGLSPTNVEIVRQSSRGSSPTVRAVLVGLSILYLQRDETVLREALFSFDVSGFEERDLTLLAESLFPSGITRLVYQQDPLSVVWAVLGDGTLATLTFERTQKVLAWARSEVGSTTAGPSAVIDATVITEGREDQLWLLVSRIVDGTLRNYVELLDPFFRTGDSPEDAFFVDSGLTGDFGAPTSLLFGLSHLKGETVRILADGATHADKVVAVDGSVTLDRPASLIHVGLPQVAGVSLLPVDLARDSVALVTPTTSLGRVKRIIDIQALLLATSTLFAGRDTAHLREINFREAGAPMDSPTPLFTGRKDIPFDGIAQEETTLVLQSSSPLPLQILAINLRLDLFE